MLHQKQNWSNRGGLLVSVFVFVCFSSQGHAQLIYHEGFETDGDGTRYTIVDRGFAITAEGPGVWGHSFDATELGLVGNAPAKRAAILWDQNADFNNLSQDALELMVSLTSWAIDNKDGAQIGFFPGFQNAPGSLFLSQLLQSQDHDVFEIPTVADLPDPDAIDLLIHTNEAAPDPPTAFSNYAVPFIGFNAGNHDDTATVGIGAALDFPGPFSVNIVEENADHPALAGKSGTIPWGIEAVQLQGVGKPHPGGKVLATVENPTTGAEDPALFIIEEGGGLLGSFSPQVPEGQHFFVGASLNKFGSASTRTLDLNPIDVSGFDDVKLRIALAATDADFEPDDFLQISVDTDASGTFQLLADYIGNDIKSLEDSLSGHVLSPNFYQDRTFDIPDDASALTIRFEALSTFPNEIVAIDDIRVFSGSITPELPCDFDADDLCNLADIDALSMEIATGMNNLDFDVNGDGVVDIADQDQWRSDAATENGFTEPYLNGDANLDGSVGAPDLNAVALSWNTSGNTWSTGDFNADGNVNPQDLNLLALSWQQSIPAAAAAVPEPGTSGWLVLGVLLPFWHRRRRTS